MPSPRKKSSKRRTPSEPTLTDTPIPVSEGASTPRYCAMYAEDGSERPARYMGREEREGGQAFADFFGILPALSVDANVRSVDSVLISLMEKSELGVAEFAPEVLAEAWQKSVGAFLGSRAELLTIADKTARIRTSHPAVRYELNQRKRQIVNALNSVLGEGCVTGVQILHG